MAVIKEAPIEVLEKLVGFGAYIDNRNSQGFTPLHTACCIEYSEAVKALLELGANPDIPNNKGVRPIETAIAVNNNDVILSLIRKSASLNVSCRFAPNTTEYLLARGDDNIVSLVHHIRAVLLGINLC